MEVISRPKELESALGSMFSRLANLMLKNVDVENVLTILEAGCGSGGLTIPLAERMNGRCRIIAFDMSSGPYEGDLEILRKTVESKKLGQIIKTVRGDVRNMKDVGNETVDLIISNELFCDLDRRGLEKALREFHRILKPEGQMAHAELNPFPANKAQELLIEADSYSLETMTPRPPWFSPSADEVAVVMHKTGFRRICVKYFETNLKLSPDAALKNLEKWKTDPKFVEKYGKELQRYGLEFPMEHVIFCEKP